MDIYKRKHIYLIPEDGADREIANGFKNNLRVNNNQIKVMPEAGGWRKVLSTFVEEYIPKLKSNKFAHVIMLIDFDGKYAAQRANFEKEIPNDLKDRVFVVGVKQNPEELKKELGEKFEQIGSLLADDCFAGTETTWGHEHLRHNDPDRLRLINVVRPILFGT